MSILNEIFLHKKAEIEIAKAKLSLGEVRSLAESHHEPTRGFQRALATTDKPIGLIAEVKKASPSEGLIRPKFNAVGIASAYRSAGAQCLSVLTDEKYFQGSSHYLRMTRERSGLPCLRKDFIYDPYQVYQSRVWGADAILLIVAGLEKAALVDLAGLARSLTMDVLVEVHDEDETEMALEIGSNLIGVNNRDLRTFKTDLSVSERLIPRIASHAITVSESSINNFSDVERVRSCGANAVLVGTAFCRQNDIESAVREVMNW